MLYDSVGSLEVSVDRWTVAGRERRTSSGFDRATTTVALHGDGRTGRGEDVTYETDAHEEFQRRGPSFPLAGEWTLDDLSEAVGDRDLFFGSDPGQSVFRNYRRWAFESAALDLALKQADTTLAGALDRTYRPVRFVVSTRLGEPPTGERVLDWLARDPDLEFKLDPTSDWTAETVATLAGTDAVRVLDLKGQYQGTTVDQAADPDLYGRVLEGFPEALIEDPALTEQTRPLFAGEEDRVTWDYPIRGVDSIQRLPWEPSWLNIKPSRFGSVRSLLEAVEYCEAAGIGMFGGGQFELGVGREHLHALASVFYPDAPNDVAPSGYNDPEPSDGLPESPLDPPARPRGFEWGGG